MAVKISHNVVISPLFFRSWKPTFLEALMYTWTLKLFNIWLTRHKDLFICTRDPSYFYVFYLLLLQDMENKIRHTLNEIYFGKTRDIVNGLRSAVPLGDDKPLQKLQFELTKHLQNRAQKDWCWIFYSGEATLIALASCRIYLLNKIADMKTTFRKIMKY